MIGSNIFSEYGYDLTGYFESIGKQKKANGVMTSENTLIFGKGIVDANGNVSVQQPGTFDSIREQNESIGYYDDTIIEYGKGVIPDDNTLTFLAVDDDATVSLNGNGSPSAISIEYSTDCGLNWKTYTVGTTITIPQNHRIKFRGNNQTFSNSTSNYYSFVISGKISASGDVTSLLNGEGGDVVLPSYCYSQMFYNCTGLTTAPNLPSTTLASNCYNSMFSGCTGLTTAPALPATTLADHCYYHMFSRCKGLTSAPALPATTLANYCYSNMFYICTGLTTAPELPATTLAENCYYFMFTYCEGLTTAPVLPATTLALGSYGCMFQGCSSLSSITCLATDITARRCTSNWLNGVAATGTFTKAASMSSWTTGVNGIPSEWTVVDA